jgi:sugar phosphate isomerase/epimerase
MKIGSIITIFEKDWESVYAPLLDESFDHFELLPENQEAYTTQSIQKYFANHELIFHAPFGQANLIAPSSHIRSASKTYLTEVLEPLVHEFRPSVITTHIGKLGTFYKHISFTELAALYKQFPQICIENLPKNNTPWSMSYPHSPEQLDTILNSHTPKYNCTFDVGHWGKQGYNVYELLEKYKDTIHDIHLHDFTNDKDHLPLGTGTLDITRFMKLLRHIQYQHYLTLELGFENTRQTIESFRLISSHL